jgi:hypothetical protein
MGEFGPETVPVVVWSRESCMVIASDETIAGGSPPVTGAPSFSEPAIARRHPKIGWHLHTGNVSPPPGPPQRSKPAAIGRSSSACGREPRILAMAECRHTHGCVDVPRANPRIGLLSNAIPSDQRRLAIGAGPWRHRGAPYGAIFIALGGHVSIVAVAFGIPALIGAILIGLLPSKMRSEQPEAVALDTSGAMEGT